MTAIAFDVAIENAFGSNLADAILGNDLANCLEGRGGDDTLTGGAGPDSLDGGAGSGDVAVYAAAQRLYCAAGAGGRTAEGVTAFHTQVAATADHDIGSNHYIAAGYAEHRVPDRFDAAQYLANYADLQAAFGAEAEAAAIHYITFGYYEGRTDHALV